MVRSPPRPASMSGTSPRRHRSSFVASESSLQPPPARPTRFREDLHRASGQVDNAMQWVAFFQAICPVVPYANPIRLNVPDTVLLTPQGAPSIWYHSSASSGGVLKRKQPAHMTANAILAAFVGPHPDVVGPTEAVAVVRFGFSSRVMSRADFAILCDDMNGHKLTPLRPTGPSLPSVPFCLQRYIRPQDDKRYIVSFSLHPPCQGHSKPAMCDVFVAPYSKRYHLGQAEVVSHPERTEKPVPPPLFADRKASYDFHMGVRDAKLVSPVSLMKHLTVTLAHHINSHHVTNPVQGIVCEYIVGADDDIVYMTGVLGVSCMHDAMPSWELLAHADPESHLICQHHAQLRANAATPRRPPPPDKTAPTPSTQTPRFPSVPNAQVSSTDEWTRGVASADRCPRYKNASPSKFFRDGKFVTKLSAMQCESSCRLHLPMHRACRPALMVDLARQVEDFREDLVQQTERCIKAEERAVACVHETYVATQHRVATDAKLATLQRDHMHQRERWECQYMLSEDLAMRAFDCLTQQAARIATLEARNSAHDVQLQHQVAQSRYELDKLRLQDAAWAAQVVAKDVEIARLLGDQEKARQQAIADTLQREGSQAYVHSLRAQISLLKREKEVLRKEATRYMAERDDLLRVLPVVTSIADKKASKPIRVNVSDLFEPGDNAKEINMLQLMLTSHTKALKGVFQGLTLQSVGASAAAGGKATLLSLPAFVNFATACGFLQNVSLDELHAMVQKATKDDRKAASDDKGAIPSSAGLTYTQFCECLVRLAHVLYKTELPQLTKRFAYLIDNDLASYEKSKFASDIKEDEGDGCGHD
ncbi:hypothetical protein, variant [Aphanomyces invadans]|uniref:EF-hand domain-containing protein n=1 Tax=Aphanomyces invadans TaxID=157072 RepID=A0A024TMQ4_9STRA|nr:hypothetical protein, variant [Aphanomyces invadans]ETV95400.1 hypothetical protein, variant [Aphanomyces invadans]|eukprot:XP_008876101.1 hypothetical protein, variant [Aphanomyces invadans]